MARIVKLGELGDIFIGLTYKPEDISSEGIIVLRSGNIQDGKLAFDDIVRVKCKVRENLYVKPNDILMCSRNGSAKLVGKCTLLPELSEKMSFGAFMTVIRTPYNRYLRYFFDSPAFRNQLKSSATTTINQITRKMLDEIYVPLYDIPKQEHISQQFALISKLVSLRKEQLAKLDELVKARFVEMFGDPLNGVSMWPIMMLADVCKQIYGGGTPSKSHLEYFTGSIPWVTPKDMKSLVIHDSIDHITEEAIENSTTNLIPIGSVLMVIRSGILKHTLPVALNSVPVTINQDMKAFVPNDEITAEYLLYYFKAIESDVLSGVRSVTADNIDFKVFQKRTIVVPPLELQNQFASFVEQTNKSKLTIQASLDKLEVMKKALMQEYFG